jgi:hypothetical protein
MVPTVMNLTRTLMVIAGAALGVLTGLAGYAEARRAPDQP